MTARAELSVRAAPNQGRDSAEVRFECPHGLFTLPTAAGDDLAPVVAATLGLHDELRGGPCTGQAWIALRAGVLPIPGATISTN